MSSFVNSKESKETPKKSLKDLLNFDLTLLTNEEQKNILNILENSKLGTIYELENNLSENIDGDNQEEEEEVPDAQLNNLFGNMDAANQKAVTILFKKGPEEAIKHMLTDQETGKPWSYAEMRAHYG